MSNIFVELVEDFVPYQEKFLKIKKEEKAETKTKTESSAPKRIKKER